MIPNANFNIYQKGDDLLFADTKICFATQLNNKLIKSPKAIWFFIKQTTLFCFWCRSWHLIWSTIYLPLCLEGICCLFRNLFINWL